MPEKRADSPGLWVRSYDKVRKLLIGDSPCNSMEALVDVVDSMVRFYNPSRKKENTNLARIMLQDNRCVGIYVNEDMEEEVVYVPDDPREPLDWFPDFEGLDWDPIARREREGIVLEPGKVDFEGISPGLKENILKSDKYPE